MGKSKDLATLKTSGLSIDDGGLSVKDAHSQLTLTDSDDDKFVLTSYSGGKYVVRNNSTNTTANQFTLTEDGKLGVGTISPNRLLSVSSSTTRTSGFEDIAEYVTPSIGVGGSTSLNVGKANSNYNLGKMAFKYNGAGSTSNELGFGFYGADNLLKVDGAGRVTKPNQPHILGTPKNSSGNGIANAFYTHSSYPPIGLSFSNSRITVPVAGVYLITFNSIADNGTGREDINIVINGVAQAQSLTATNESGYRQNNVVNAFNLDANDYIQFDHDDWYNPGSVGYDAWITASVTLLG